MKSDADAGNRLVHQGEYERAIECYRRSLRVQPRHETYSNLGLCYLRLGRPADAARNYERAIELAPDHDGHRASLAVSLLANGDFARGWPAYEWRERSRKQFPLPQWGGEQSGHLLVKYEQGIGDQVLYASMIPDLAMDVTLSADPRLVPLFQRSFPRAAIVSRYAKGVPATFTHQSSIAGLGKWLRPSFDSFPARRGYLKPEHSRVEAFRARLKGPVVGIAWSSSSPLGPVKNVPLAQWRDILRAPVSFVDLQYGDTASEREGLPITHFDDLDLYNDLEGLAALCAACDLVITTSNVTAHFAGAVGTPVWLIAPVGGVWYWFVDRTDCPWYPSMRIYGKPRGGDFPMQEVARDLRERLHSTL